MRNSKTLTGMLAFVILFQYMCMRNSPIFEYELPFLSGLTSADSMSGNMLLTLYSIIPLPFLFMLFSGDMRDLTEGYGKLKIIRSYSKRNLVLCLLGKTAVVVTIITLFMGSVFTLFQANEWKNLEISLQGRGLAMYSLTICAMILVQFILELYLEVQYANLSVIIGMTVCIFISNVLGTKSYVVNLVLFPSLAFAQKNGVIQGDEVGVSFTGSVIWIILINIFLGVFILKKFTKKDIM